MPALRAFGRRWNLGSDDLVYPGLIELFVRTTWLLALVIVFFLEVDQYSCENGEQIQIFYIGTMAFLGTYLFVNSAMTVVSARGYLMDTEPRRHIAGLLYLKLAIFIPEVGWTVLGSIWVFKLDHDCSLLAMTLAQSAVVMEWLVILCTLLTIYVMFDPLGQRHVKKRSLKDYHHMWYSRCRMMCCCLKHDENRADAFEDIAHLLSNFFRGRDIVFTDVMCGVTLLSIKQAYQRRINPIPVLPVSETDTLQIRSCQRSEYFESKSDRFSKSISSPPLTYRTSRASADYPGTSVNYDTRAAPRTASKRHSWGENSVNAGQPDRYFVESEETKLYDANGKTIPTYGSASESPVDVSSTSDSDHERPTKRTERIRPRGVMKMQDSVASSSSSWSTDSTSCHGFAPTVGPKSWMTLENVAYYLRYATAIYGSSNYGGCYNCQDRIPLCRRYRCTSGDAYLDEEVLVGDNYWECEASSVMLYAHLDRQDIIYASLDNQIFKTPYFIAKDNNKKVVVIAIRGTMSAGDAITDLTAHGQDIEVEHLPKGNVHKGILKAARMMEDQILNEIGLQDKIPKGYGLVVTGHSLGAGIATVLALLLRDLYADVTCFSFSPPGGLVSMHLSQYLQEFVLCCFLGMDVVARLSVANMERLKTDILAVIKNSRLPKYKVLSSGIHSMCCGCLPQDESLLLEDTQTTKLSLQHTPSTVSAMSNMSAMSAASARSDSSVWQNVAVYDKDILVDNKGKARTTMKQISMTSQDSDVFVDNLSDASDIEYHTTSINSESRSRVVSMDTCAGRPSKNTSVSSYGSYTSYSSYAMTGSQQPKHPIEHRLSDSHVKWQQGRRKVGLAAMDPLYLPGQILYLYEDEEMLEVGCCSNKPVYKARWAQAGEFDTIHLHSCMMHHHNPYTIDEALQQILLQRQFGSDAQLYGVYRQQPGLFASPYDYDAVSPEGTLRRGSEDSGIAETCTTQVPCTTADLGEVNQAFDGSQDDPDSSTPQPTCTVTTEPDAAAAAAAGEELVDSIGSTSDAICPAVVVPCREFSVSDDVQVFHMLETSQMEIFVSSPCVLREYAGDTIETYVLGTGDTDTELMESEAVGPQAGHRDEEAEFPTGRDEIAGQIDTYSSESQTAQPAGSVLVERVEDSIDLKHTTEIIAGVKTSDETSENSSSEQRTYVTDAESNASDDGSSHKGFIPKTSPGDELVYFDI